MKTKLTITEFETLIASKDWQREQDLEIMEHLDRQIEVWDEEKESLEWIDIPHVWGWASKTSVLNGITITYSEGFNYDEYEPDSLNAGTEGPNDVWTIEGVSVVDEEGDELSTYELADYLNTDFSSINYNALEIEQVTDVDVIVNGDSDMQTFTLKIDNAPSVRFTGELIASAASSENQAMASHYSGQVGRWTELALYKTKGGKYICHKVKRTLWQKERDCFSGAVCETLKDVQEFFGHNWLAKELYAEAMIDDAIEIEA